MFEATLQEFGVRQKLIAQPHIYLGMWCAYYLSAYCFPPTLPQAVDFFQGKLRPAASDGEMWTSCTRGQAGVAAQDIVGEAGVALGVLSLLCFHPDCELAS